eukprot:COSAG01_NODE_53856_length_336_cov_0.805907_1_plen_37_part_10
MHKIMHVRRKVEQEGGRGGGRLTAEGHDATQAVGQRR